MSCIVIKDNSTQLTKKSPFKCKPGGDEYVFHKVPKKTKGKQWGRQDTARKSILRKASTLKSDKRVSFGSELFEANRVEEKVEDKVESKCGCSLF